jgi:predicted regulator of Ras-like GTPase activity (Roadblock/LC7/MglB family)
MSFREILKSSVDSVDGGMASVVMGFDGIAVEEYVQNGSGVDVQTLGVEYSSALTEVRRTAESLASGNVQEVAVMTDGATVLLRPVNTDYFIALVLAKNGNFGKGRYVLRRAARAIAEEM